MSSGPPLLGRYHVERRLGGDDDAPLLVRDDTDPSARLVFRPIPREAVAAANRFSGASHPRLARWLGVRGSALDGWFMVSEFVAGVDFAVALPSCRDGTPSRCCVTRSSGWRRSTGSA